MEPKKHGELEMEDFRQYPVWFDIEGIGFVPCLLDDPERWDYPDVVMVLCKLTFADGTERHAIGCVQTDGHKLTSYARIYCFHLYDDLGKNTHVGVSLFMRYPKDLAGFLAGLGKSEAETFPIHIESCCLNPEYLKDDELWAMLTIKQVVRSYWEPGISEAAAMKLVPRLNTHR